MSAVRTILSDPIPEKSTWKFTGIIKDESGAAIPSASFTTLTLTLYDLLTEAIINSVNGINILNTGRGTVDSNGNLAIVFDPADNAIQNANSASEQHIALIQWTYAAGAKAGKHEVEFTVKNLAKVT